MNKTIDHLKAVVTDGMRLLSDSSPPIVIRRFPNNVIKVHNRIISWQSLQDLLINGEYALELNDTESNVLEFNKSSWGGYRVPGPGKKLGRKTVRDKKVPLTLSVRESVKEKMNELLEIRGIDKNEFFKHLINTAHDELKNKIQSGG